MSGLAAFGIATGVVGAGAYFANKAAVSTANDNKGAAKALYAVPTLAGVGVLGLGAAAAVSAYAGAFSEALGGMGFGSGPFLLAGAAVGLLGGTIAGSIAA